MVAFALVAVGACTGDAIDNTFDPCAPLVLVASDPTALQQTGIESAQALWRERGVPAIGQPGGSTLAIHFDGSSSKAHGIYDDHAAVIHINRAVKEPDVLSIVIAHELGHALGLLHVPASERVSVMNPGNTVTPPTAADQAALEALWGDCPR